MASVIGEWRLQTTSLGDVEKKKPALGGVGGLLVQIRASSLLATCGSDAH
jgi:hypothetical protein